MRILQKTAVAAILLLNISISVSAAEPVEIIKGEADGLEKISKVYILKDTESPDMISRDSFLENDVEFQFSEMLTQDNTKTETREHTENRSVYLSSNNTQTAISKFEPMLEVATEDGFLGTAEPDFSSLTIASAGKGTQKYTITENRTYPNLMDADTSLVPKSISKNGSTLNLTNISWNSAASDNIDGHDLAVRYTATATYSGTGTKTYNKGYTATVTYKGNLEKVIDDTITYTAVFTEIPKAEPNHFQNFWWAYLLGLMFVGGSGYGIYRVVRQRRKGY